MKRVLLLIVFAMCSMAIHAQITVNTQDVTLNLDVTGNASITAQDVDDGSTSQPCIPGMTYEGAVFTINLTGTNSRLSFNSGEVRLNNSGEPVKMVPANTIDSKVRVGDVLYVETIAQRNGEPTGRNLFRRSFSGLNDVVWEFNNSASRDSRMRLIIEQATGQTGEVVNFSAPFNLKFEFSGEYIQHQSNGISLPSSNPVNYGVNLISGDLGTNDPCAIASLSLDQTSFDCSNVGVNTVTLTVTDTQGNTNTDTAQVIVEDNIAPVITCAPAVSDITNDTNGMNINYDLPTIQDNCVNGGTTVSGEEFIAPQGTTFLGARNGSMYFLSDTSGTTVNNYATAASLGQSLVVINDQEENDFLVNLLTGTTSTVQIGLDDLITEGAFEWQDGSALTYTNWNAGEPNNSSAGGEDYTQLILSGANAGLWNDTTGAASMNYLLEVNANNFKQPANTTLIGVFEGHTYFVSNSTVLPSVAFTTTATNGYSLVSIDDAEENAFITSKIGAYSSGVLLGINDVETEGIFVNQDGSTPAYTNWNSGEPNNFGTGEDYAVIFTNGLWNDIGDSLINYIIEIPTTFVQTAGLVSGEQFPIGTTTNTFAFYDNGGNVATCSTDVTVNLDNTAPVLTAVSITSDNTNSAFAKAGDTITLTFTADEDLQATPVVTIAGQSATVIQGADAQNWTATYMVPTIATLDQTALPDGSVSFTVDFADLLGNNATQVTTTTDASAINIDRTIPTLTVVGIASDNSDSAFAKAGDTITLTFTSDEDLVTPTVTIAGQTATVQQGSDAQNWSATYVVPDIATLDQTALPDGAITFSIQHADMPGNTATTIATTDSSVVTLIRGVPNALAQGITVNLDAAGNANITAQNIDNGSTDSAGNPITNLSLDRTSFDCNDLNSPFSNSLDFNNVGTVSLLPNKPSGNQSRTISFWVKSNADIPNGQLKLFLDYGSNFTGQSIAMGARNGGIYLETYNRDINFAAPVLQDEWFHMTMTHDGSKTVLYYNGREVGELNFALNTTNNSLHIGKSRNGGSSATLDGNMSNLKIYDRALTPQEVLQDMIIELPLDQASVMYHFDFNQATGDAVDNVAGLSVFPIATSSLSYSTEVAPKLAQAQNVTLTVVDNAGNSNSEVAQVTILDNIAPVITLNGNATETIAQGSTYTDAGTTATDNCSLDVNGVVIGGDTVDSSILGTYLVTYNAMDASGNTAAEVTRTVVVEDQTAPVLMLSLSSDNGFNSAFAKAGDLITLSLISNEDLQASPVVTIAGQSATVTQGVDAQNWTATYTVPDIPTLDQTVLPDGVALITIAYSDTFGNAATASNTTDGTAVQIIRTVPDTSTQDITVALDANGNATISPQDVSNAAASSCLEGMSYGGAIVKVQGSTGTQMGNSSSTFVTGTSNGFPVAFVPAPASRQASTLYDGIKVRAGDIVVLRVDSSSPGRVGASPSFNIASGRFVWGGYSPNGNFANRPELQIQQAGKSTGDIIDFSSPFNLRLRANGNYMRSGSTWNSSSTPEDLTVSLETGDLGATDPCANITYQLDQDTFNCLDTGMNTVTITATDGIGNSSTATALVTVIDDTVPVINCVNDINARALDPNGVVVTYAEPTVTDNCFSNGMPLTVSQLNEAPAGTTLLGTYNGHNYFISTATYTSNEAYDITAALTTGYMVTIDDVAENTFITNALTNAGQFTAFIGLHDRTTDGVYEWQNGDPVNYINWNSGEPNNAPPGERHVQIRNGGWDDVLDTHINPYIVEVPFSVEQTSGFASGEMFPTGTTTNTFVFNFSDGSSQTCSFDVNIDQDFLYENGVWTPNDPSSSQNPSGLDDNVVIRDNVTISNTIRANDFTVENGALLSIDNGAVIFVANNLAVQNLDARDAVIVAFGQDNSNTWNFNNTVLGTLELANADLVVTGDIRLTTALRNDDTVSTSTLDVTGANVTFVSDVNGTAMVDGAQIDIIGDVTVEQYYRDRRAFRFISSPVNMTSTIFDNLQQGGLNFGDPGYESGFGTHITGVTAPANGFDVTSTNNPSMFGWDNVNQSWVERTSTNQPQDMLIAGEYHRLMVRGDREIDLTSNLSSSSTTLRYNGSLLNSSYSVNAISANEDDFMIVGNPYQSLLNLNAYLQDSFNGLSTDINAVKPLFYFVWDPMINSRGGYRTYSLQLDTFVGGSAPASDFIPGILQPGQSAFFAASGINGGTFQISRDSNALLPPDPNASITNAQASLEISLHETAQFNNGGGAMDAILLRFDSTSNNGLDSFDAAKLGNLDENISRDHISGSLVSIENRAMPVHNEMLMLNINNYRHAQYTLEVSSIGLVGINAYLKDNFTGILTQLNNNQSTDYNFSIDVNDALSVDPNRFEIVFQNITLSNQDNEALNSQIKLYPNPVSNGVFYLDFGTLQGTKSVKIYNALGQMIQEVPEDSSDMMIMESTDFATGVYLLEITINDKERVTKRIVIQ